ncbi:MAG: phosphatidylserine synthase [Bacteroidetes bacterium]|nr:phosphatidylserine synthase [Bacteroidota bacterium]
MPVKRNIPNAITCGNLLCGCLAIVKCLEGDLLWASYLVGIAAVLDFLDGFAARMLRVTSAIGKDLDSLADMVTFGVVPGLIMFKLICNAAQLKANSGVESAHLLDPASPYYLSYIAFLVPVFSAIRLAKFNNDTRQSESFIGLPTPANGILICSFPLIIEYSHSIFFMNTVYHPMVLIFISCFLSYLLVAEIPLFSLKFKNFKWRGNEIRFIFLIWSCLLLAILHFIGIPVAILSYILFSFSSLLLLRKRNNS